MNLRCGCCRDNPPDVLHIPGLLMSGTVSLKAQDGQQCKLLFRIPAVYDRKLTWLKQQREAGRRLILCTASDHPIAQAIAGHPGVFNEIMASNGQVNLAGRHKVEGLEMRFCQGCFDYMAIPALT